MNRATPRRTFHSLLLNTLIANITTGFLWFALIFWMYLETRSVIVTATLGGSYMLLTAAMGIPFGSWVDRTRKKRVMVIAQTATTLLFTASLVLFLLTPQPRILAIGSLEMVAFVALVLAGAVAGSARGIALSTCVTILVPDEERGRANGLVGMVGGMSFALTSVFSGLAVGLLGMTWALSIAATLTLLTLAHLASIRIPEPTILPGEEAPGLVDLGGAWRAIRRVPGLVWLIVFTTFNNALAGVHMALLDAYGLTLVSVEFWGVLWGLLSFAFILGSAWVARFGLGPKPLRALLVANIIMWTASLVFTLRESIWLLAVGVVVYLALIPVAEAAEQTVLQRVVPLPQQGRVCGFAQSAEVAAMPAMGFLIGPVAEFGLIPYMDSPAGRSTWGWLLGAGDARGIALVFVIASLGGLAATLLALASGPYRRLSRSYGHPSATVIVTHQEVS